MAETTLCELVARTDPGLVRARNEDAVVLADLDAGETLDAERSHELVGPRGPLLAVLDGMGGTRGGHVASRVAAETLWAELAAAPATSERPVFARHLRRAVRAANRRIRSEAARDPELSGMGTTVSAAALVDGVAVLAQVGDSRAYLYRGARLTQITRDQSVVSALVSAGKLTESQARVSMQRSLILQALGAAEDVEVAISIAELRRGDRLLLCSDGLHGVVPDAAIASVLGPKRDLAAAADALIDLARAGGAPDNVSVVIAAFTGDALPAPLGDDDQPRFTELDPSEEGERALTETSLVARRLARRAGLRPTSDHDVVPATGPHAILRHSVPSAAELAERPPAGPAEAALAARRRLGALAWLAVIAAAAVVIAYVLFGGA